MIDEIIGWKVSIKYEPIIQPSDRIYTQAFFFLEKTLYTPAERAAYEAEKAEENRPVTSAVKLVDGCTLYYYYGDGRNKSYTTKFVRCDKAEVTTERKYSCGSGKSPKTCTEQIVTGDGK